MVLSLEWLLLSILSVLVLLTSSYLKGQRPIILGLLSMNYGLLYGKVAHDFGLLGFGGSVWPTPEVLPGQQKYATMLPFFLEGFSFCLLRAFRVQTSPPDVARS